MITIKNNRDIAAMRRAGRIAHGALELAGSMVAPGVASDTIDRAVGEYIRSAGATPSFLGYNGYPSSITVSINEAVIHGMPSAGLVIRQGDIVSIDVGATYDGYVGDTAGTYAAGEVSSEALRLMEVTRQALDNAIAVARKGNRIGDIGHAVQSLAESNGYSVIRAFTGHGVGRKMHEDPGVPNYGTAHHGVRLVPGMTIAIEPMVAAGHYEIRVLSDGWTVVTLDGSLASHYEHTILVTDADPVILTTA